MVIDGAVLAPGSRRRQLPAPAYGSLQNRRRASLEWPTFQQSKLAHFSTGPDKYRYPRGRYPDIGASALSKRDISHQRTARVRNEETL
jgi:hypothetical protein